VAHRTVEQLPQTLGHSMQCAEFDLTETTATNREQYVQDSSESAGGDLFETGVRKIVEFVVESYISHV